MTRLLCCVLGVALLATSCADERTVFEQKFPEAARQLLQASEGHALQLGESSARRGISLPLTSRDPIRIRLQDFEVDVFERALDGDVLRESRFVSYARQDGRSYWAARADGVEEWVEHFSAADGPVAVWDVRGASLKQLEDAVVLEDDRGLGRLRVTAPVAWSIDGTRGRAWLRAEGSTLALYTDLRGHVLVDPLWVFTSPLGAAHTRPTVTQLTDGRLFVFGGEQTSGGSATRAPRTYDPTTGTWTDVPDVSGPGRIGHSATLLRDGRVLIVGGFDVGGAANNSAEIFNPANNSLSATGALLTARHNHTATLLADGRVLIAGGETTGPALASAEVYTPGTGLFTTTGSLAQPRSTHRSVRLQDGTVLAIGGVAPQTSSVPLTSCERFNPATNTWSASGAIATGRTDFSATVLHSGQVLLTGGITGTTYLTSSERFNPATNTWSATGALTTGRRTHTATLLPSGKVLVAGGAGPLGANIQTGELYDPVAGTWSAGGSMGRPRAFASAGLLPNGKVLVIGGIADAGAMLSTTELFDVAFNQSTFSATGSLATARRDGAAITLHDGRVLVIGGVNASGTTLASCEIYSPATGTWAATGAMGTARSGFGATLLANGKVLVAGGTNGTTALASAELFDPTTNTWSATGNLINARQRLSLTATPSGPTFAVGGFSGSLVVDRIELYSPRTGTWSEIAAGGPLARWGSGTALLGDERVFIAGGYTDAAGTTVSNAYSVCSMSGSCSPSASFSSMGRALPTATLLPNGKALLAGGTNGSSPATSAWVYDPATSSIGGTGTIPGGGLAPMDVARFDGSTAVLPNGKVLIVGGRDATNAPITNTTLYDPGRGTFEAGPALAVARAASHLAVLPSGKVLIIGGITPSGPTTSVELYDEGRATATVATPTITPATLTTLPNTALTFAGTLFEGLSEGGRGGVDFFSSAAPLVQLRAAESDRRYRVGLSSFSPTSLTTRNLTMPPGLYWLSVTTGGAVSVERPLSLNTPLTLTPASPSVPPRGAQAFTGGGGLGTRSFSFATNASGGTVDPSTGAYVAGTTGSVTDVVRVTDDQGRSALANVTVGPGVSGSPASVTRPPRGTQSFTASGGSGTGFSWVMLTSNSGGGITDAGVYTAGSVGSRTDTARVTDSLGNTANVTITVSAGVSASPANATLAPRASQAFTASGGSGAGFTWTLDSNPSGGSVAGATYTAGATGSVTDVLRVTDSLGNFATVNLTITAGVSLSPAAPSVPPQGSRTFTASGGSGTGFSFSLTANPSGGSITTAGVYTAGPNEGTDVVRVVDSLGNTASTNVTVTSRLSITPGNSTVPPRTQLVFTASGGSGTGFTWSLLTNGSNATFTPATATYRAGSMPNAMDVVQVTDSLGNTATVTITTSAALSIAGGGSTIPPRGAATFSASGGSGAGFTWSLSTNASGGSIGAATGQYTAGATGSVVDLVEVTDSLGNTATLMVPVGPVVTVMPAMPIVSPSASVVLTATGGSGNGYTWSITSVPAVGTLNANTGEYRAGTTGDVSDTVRVVDSLGNAAIVTVRIAGSLQLSPSMVTLAPLARQTFTAAGGSSTGYRYTFMNSPSGGSLDPNTGEYRAGATGGVTDELVVTDSLGNTARASVVVTEALTLTPNTGNAPPRGTIAFSARGGGTTKLFALTSNGSGGTIDAATGVYVVGATPGVTDVITVSDEHGAMASASITVTAGLTVSPDTITLVPGAEQTFTASGGSGAGFTWTLEENTSGASLDAASGAYVAGETGGGIDTLLVTDSLGNTARATISVVAPGGIVGPPYSQRPPVSGWALGCSSSGGDGALALLAGLLFFARRRRGLAVAALVGVLSLPVFAAPSKKKPAKPAKVAPVPVPEPTPVVTPTPPPPVELPPTPPPAKRQRTVAVTDVSVAVPDEKMDAAGFTELVTNGVEAAKIFKVINARDIALLLGVERQRALLGCDETSCMSELASALGSDFIVTGAVTKVGGKYLVTVKMLDAQTSRVLGRSTLEANEANALLAAFWRATQEALEQYGAGLQNAEAAAWAARPKAEPPASVRAEVPVENFFGINLLGVLGYQPLSDPGLRGSLGAEVDLTFRRGRLDLGAGMIIGPNLGARILASVAVVDTRFRLGVGVRGTAYPGLTLFGGGLGVNGDFALTKNIGVVAIAAGEIYPAPGSPVVVILGALGVSGRL